MGLGLGAYVGLVDGQKYIEFIAPGIIASYAMSSASFECTYGSFVRMEYQKTYDAIIATPLNIVPSIYSFNYYFTLFITPMFFFSGVFFPLSSFPEIVQTLSWIAPLTPVVHLTRALINGEFYTDLLWALALIIGLTALFFSISLVTMRRRLTV